MGMYTELYMRTTLKRETPKEIIETLEYMTGQSEVEVKQPFVGSRWKFMLKCSSFYHCPYAHSSVGRTFDEGPFYLMIRCDFKNYENELENFVEWIMPYIDGTEGEYIGHSFYEEDELPTPIIYRSV